MPSITSDLAAPGNRLATTVTVWPCLARNWARSHIPISPPAAPGWGPSRVVRKRTRSVRGRRSLAPAASDPCCNDLRDRSRETPRASIEHGPPRLVGHYVPHHGETNSEALPHTPAGPLGGADPPPEGDGNFDQREAVVERNQHHMRREMVLTHLQRRKNAQHGIAPDGSVGAADIAEAGRSQEL